MRKKNLPSLFLFLVWLRLSATLFFSDDRLRDWTEAPVLDSGSDGRLIAQMSLRRQVAVEMMNDVCPALLPLAIKSCLENNRKLLNQWRVSGSLK